MEFLHVALLPFAAVAAVPVVLHLLTLHRLRTVELPTFRFLFDSYVQQRRRMRFLEALLAALRALFLLVLVLAFSRPVARSWASLFPTGTGREVVMLVDGSASMNATSGGLSSLGRAKSVAIQVAESLRADDRLTLIRVTAKPEEVFSRYSGDSKGVRDKIEGLSAGPTRANFFAAMAYVFDASARRFGKPTVYVFSDGQASGWREVRDQGLGKLVPAGSKVVLVDVGPKQPIPNRAVVGDPPGRQRAIVGLPYALRPRVVNDAKGGATEGTVSVFLNDKEIARTPLSLKPGETATKRVVFTPEEPGTYKGRFEVAGKAPDGFPDDDSYLFTLTVDPPAQVLLVNGNPSGDPFEDEALYLRTALTAGRDEALAAADPTKPQSKTGLLAGTKALQRALDVREIPEGNLNPETLRDAAVVILANCGNLNGDQFAKLRDFVAAGGGLIVLPGERVNPDVYNTQFFPVPGPQKERITPASLGPPAGDLEKPETFEHLAAVDYAHPALTVFDDPDGRYLRTAHFSRRFPIKLPEKGANAWPLAQFGSGAPALVESRFGSGVVLVAAFPANAKWSNLALKPEFVPLVLRLATYAKSRADLEVSPVVPAEGVAEVAVAGTWGNVSGKVTDAKGRSAPLSFERSNSRLVAPFEATGERGYYAVDVKGGRVEAPKAGASAFAVNLDTAESKFARIDPDLIRDAMPGADVTLVDASAEAQQKLGRIGEEREVWRPMIVMLFAIIGCEFMLATLGGPRRRSAEADDEPGRVFAASPRGVSGTPTG